MEITKPKKIYIVYFCKDPYAGIILEGVFLTKKLAEDYIKKNEDWQHFEISEEKLITE